jgi:glucosamine 6-phosphate synthetase-like amidotransferase/phosphosugar isomerase protein
MPVVAIATQDELYEKMISQIQQAKARGGKVIAVATEGDEGIRAEADYVLYVPACTEVVVADYQCDSVAVAELPYGGVAGV